jgi:hypothetical protein
MPGRRGEGYAPRVIREEIDAGEDALAESALRNADLLPNDGT